MYLSRKQSIAIAIGLIAIFFLVGSLFIETKESPVAIDLNPKTESNVQSGSEKNQIEPTFTLEDFHRSEIDKHGNKIWEVKAKEGQYFPKTNLAEVKNATVWFYREEEEQAIIIKSDQATLFIDGTTLSKADMAGNISMDYAGEFTVLTGEATYFKEEHAVHAPGFVRIFNEQYDIQGKKLDAQLETREFVLHHEVESVLHPKNKTSS